MSPQEIYDALDRRDRKRQVQAVLKYKRKRRRVMHLKRTLHLHKWLELVRHKLTEYEIKALEDVIDYRTVSNVMLRKPSNVDKMLIT